MPDSGIEQDASPEVASQLNAFLTGTIKELEGRINHLQQEVRSIEQLVPMTEESERVNALAASTENLVSTAKKLARVAKEAGYGGLGAPVQTVKAMLAVRRARLAHIECERVFDEPATQAQRTTLITAHNQHIASEWERLRTIRPTLVSSQARLAEFQKFRQDANDAISAARSDGWVRSGFWKRFCTMAARAQDGDIIGATGLLLTLTFQRKPVKDAYIAWHKEATIIRDNAYASYAGMPASGSYPEVATRSIELGRQTLRKNAVEIVDSYVHPADQWQALSAILTNPLHLQVDAVWAIYWSMFQCGQWTAAALSEADAHEDVFTGKFSAQIDRWLSSWATERVRNFGYPEVTSYMGTLEIAGTAEETRLGADIGLVIDLEIGDLICRKVALLQAKKVKHGIADIGSNSGQLPMLASHPNKGFYLFYHQSAFPVKAPAPTVCSAQVLADMVRHTNRSLNAHHLNVGVRAVGWDWASFVTFGLCQPESGLGEPFKTPMDALEVLGSGTSGELPRYLHVIAIADEQRTLALRQQIHQHYRDITKTKTKVNDKSQRRERGIDGPERGPSL